MKLGFAAFRTCQLRGGLGKFVVATIFGLSMLSGNSAFAAPPDTTDPICGNWSPSGSTWDQTSVTFTLSNSTDAGIGIDVAGGSCNVTTDGNQCTVQIKDKANNTRNCTSPTGRIDSTPPSCDTWFIRLTPSDSYYSWNGAYDEVSIPWTDNKKSIYVTGTDVGGSGMSATTYNCNETNNATSVAFCDATISDKVGNSVVCGGAGSAPRVRQDNTPPATPTLNCVLLNPADPGQYGCTISTPTGPSPSSIYFQLNGGVWNYNGRLWYLSQAGSLVAQDTQTTYFPVNVTPGTSLTVRVRVDEIAGSVLSSIFTISAPIVPPAIPPADPVPAPQVVGGQTFGWMPRAGYWYSCGAALSWPYLSEGVSTPSAGSTTYCSSDGDGKSWVPGATVGNGGSTSCLCYDAVSPEIGTITASNNTWTNSPVSFSATVSQMADDGSAYQGATYSCPGNSGTTGGAGVSFTCSQSSPSAQVARIQTCDQLQCYFRELTFFIESAAPTASIGVTGSVKNHNGTTLTSSAVPSSSYTYTSNVTLTYSAADAGGSNLAANPIKISCDPNPNGAGTWQSIGGGSSAFDISNGPGCAGGDGLKSVYIHARDNAGNITTSAPASITLDTSVPTFDTNNILLRATSAYSYTVENPNGVTSPVRDYSFSWTDEYATSFSSLDQGVTVNLGTLAQSINLADGDGKKDASIVLTVEDMAGNITTKTVNLQIIPNLISAANSTVVPPSGVKVADLSDSFAYQAIIRDVHNNIVRPISGIVRVQTDWEFDNTSKFLGGGSNNDGAIQYLWDAPVNSLFVTNVGVSGNKYVGDYAGGKVNGIWRIDVKSAVPTSDAYPNKTTNRIRLGKLAFNNTLPCPASWRCEGVNSNAAGTYSPPSLGTDLASLANGYLSFKPAVEVSIEKNFTTLIDDTWHPITLKFKNNSSSVSFDPKDYVIDFHYTNAALFFGQATFSGASFGTITNPLGANQQIRFNIVDTPVVAPLAEDARNLEFKVQSWGQGFGGFGFTSYLAYSFATPKNRINSVDAGSTGYNTANSSGMSAAVTGFDSQTIALPSAMFSPGEESVSAQKLSVLGSISNNKGNDLSTLQKGVKIDTKSIDRGTIKNNIRKNVETITSGLSPRNAPSDCNMNLNSITDDLYYYDFSNVSNAGGVNGNLGCTLTIGSSTSYTLGGSYTYNKLGISGKKTIIIKGGNIQLDTDAYYVGNSMLTLIVLRSDKDKTRGGNVYVNPNITNFVGTAFLEGSMMSYNGTKLYDSINTFEGELTRQFYWYGSVLSANSIGGSISVTSNWKCPYGSDTYEQTKTETCTKQQASLYDFTNLRRFVLVDATTGPCSAGTAKSPKSSGTSSEKYAIAGKKECFMTDGLGVAELRTTAETAPVVIEYNSFIATAGVPVLTIK